MAGLFIFLGVSWLVVWLILLVISPKDAISVLGSTVSGVAGAGLGAASKGMKGSSYSNKTGSRSCNNHFTGVDCKIKRD